MADTDTFIAYRERLADLAAQRDKVNAQIAPKQDELARLNLAAEEARLAAEVLAKEISDLRGGQAYLDIKREIAALSTMLSGKKRP